MTPMKIAKKVENKEVVLFQKENPPSFENWLKTCDPAIKQWVDNWIKHIQSQYKEQTFKYKGLNFTLTWEKDNNV